MVLEKTHWNIKLSHVSRAKHIWHRFSVILWYFADDTSSSLWLLGEMVRTVIVCMVRQPSSHMAAALRSNWRSSQWCCDLSILEMMLWLANSLSLLDFRYSCKSFIHTKNKPGSRIVPWETRDVRGTVSDDSPARTTVCVRSEGKAPPSLVFHF
jgi:hypothetical protein